MSASFTGVQLELNEPMKILDVEVLTMGSICTYRFVFPVAKHFDYPFVIIKQENPVLVRLNMHRCILVFRVEQDLGPDTAKTVGRDIVDAIRDEAHVRF